MVGKTKPYSKATSPSRIPFEDEENRALWSVMQVCVP